MNFLVAVMRVVAPISIEELERESYMIQAQLKKYVLESERKKVNINPAYTDELPELLRNAPELLARGKRLQGKETKTKAIIGVAYAKAYADSHGNGVTLYSWSGLDGDLIVYFAQLIQYYRQQNKLALLFMQLILASQ